LRHRHQRQPEFTEIDPEQHEHDGEPGGDGADQVLLEECPNRPTTLEPVTTTLVSPAVSASTSPGGVRASSGSFGRYDDRASFSSCQ
jgi:hypothetical protein